MIIDCHSHLYNHNSAKEFFQFDGEPDGALSLERFVEHALSEPVDHMILSADPEQTLTAEGFSAANDRVAEVARRWPQRFSGLCQVNPHFPAESLAEMDKHLAKGNLIGIGELCQYILKYETTDKRMFAFIERAIELDVPVLEHASNKEHTDGLDKLAAMFPAARFIMAHVGGMYNWPNGIEVAARHGNVWVDISGFVGLCYGALPRAYAALGAGKMLFGVDFPLVSAAPIVTALHTLRLSDDDYDRVAWRNAAELFKLDTERMALGR